ncbi:MAG: hypothetical protein ABI476_08665 [Oxalobacteraceae bacterium]
MSRRLQATMSLALRQTMQFFSYQSPVNRNDRKNGCAQKARSIHCARERMHWCEFYGNQMFGCKPVSGTSF